MGRRRNKCKKVSNPKIKVITQPAPQQEKIEKLLDEKPVPLPPAPSVALRLAAAKKQRFTEDFANAIAVIMRTPQFREMPIADLEWFLLPPLLAGQCRVAFSKSGASGPIFPSALVLWACVSDAVDKRLDAGAVKLSPADWSSGANIWLIVTAGDKQGLAALVEKLQEKEFNGRQAKIRTQQTDGTSVVRSLPLSKPVVNEHEQERLDAIKAEIREKSRAADAGA